MVSAFRISIAGLALACMASPVRAQAVGANPFFALCMDTHDARNRTLAEQAEMLRDLGYRGMGHLWLDNIEERLQTADAAGLQVYQVYFRVDLSPGSPRYDPRLRTVLPLLKGRNTQLAVLMVGGQPSDESLDPEAIRTLQEIAGLTRPFGVRIVLYPHAKFWLERVEDGLRLARQLRSFDVGVMLNLCHWLAVDEEKNLGPLLEKVRSYLAAVTINGADRAAEIRAKTGNWIQPLDSGRFDVSGFLKALKQSGYKGPIGLQCYGIRGDARDHLARSITAWREWGAAAVMK